MRRELVLAILLCTACGGRVEVDAQPGLADPVEDDTLTEPADGYTEDALDSTLVDSASDSIVVDSTVEDTAEPDSGVGYDTKEDVPAGSSVTKVAGLGFLAMGGDSIFATSATERALYRIEKATGAATTLATVQVPSGLAADSWYVYWSDRGTAAVAGRIARTAHSGGAFEVVGGKATRPVGLALARSDLICWTDEEVTGGTIACGWRNRDALVLAESGGIPPIVGTNADVCWRSPDKGWVRCVRLAGSTVWSAGIASPALASTATHVYAIEGGSLWSIRLLDHTVDLRAKGVGVDVAAMTADAEAVYLGTASGWIRRIKISDGSVVTLATGEGPVHSIEVDETHVYWTRASDGVLRRTSK